MTKNFHSLYFCIKQCEFVFDKTAQFHVKRKNIQVVAELASIHLKLGHEKKETNFSHSTIYHLLSITYFPSHQNVQQVETISLCKLNLCTVNKLCHDLTSNACQHYVALPPSCFSGFSWSGHKLDSCILIR